MSSQSGGYYLPEPSRWPIVGSIGLFFLALGAVFTMNAVSGGWYIVLVGAIVMTYMLFGWFGTVIRESESGKYNKQVDVSFRWSMSWFIFSEVMFFAAWFWSFFKHAMYPMGPDSPRVDGVWPPVGIETFDPFHLPLINTLILLCSGAAATWAHHALVHEENREDMKMGLWIAIALGAVFTLFQAYEYSHAAFGFSGNIYGANFFMATGFHGFHVLVGTIFLFICLMRTYRGHFTAKSHIGFEAAAWYWHFVDVVWLFLFFAVYIWGG